jgi:hypothetical protein
MLGVITCLIDQRRYGSLYSVIGHCRVAFKWLHPQFVWQSTVPSSDKSGRKGGGFEETLGAERQGASASEFCHADQR